MAIGSVKYKTGQNLEPVAEAVTSMGQSASKKDKPNILANKIKAISTDATATEGNVLTGQTFYASGTKKTGNMANNGAWTGRIGVNGKITIPAGYHNGSGYVDQSITSQGSYTSSLSSARSDDYTLYTRIPQGAYFTNGGSGYPEITTPLSTLRSQGYALQTEVDTWVNNYNGMVGERDAWYNNYIGMTNDRNNWMNIANSRPTKYTGTLVVGTKWIFDINNFPKILLNWQSTSGDCHAFIYIGKFYSSIHLMYVHFNGSSPGYGILRLYDGVSGDFYRTSGSSFNGNPTFKYTQSGSTITLECIGAPSGSNPSDSTAITYTYYI